MFSRPKNITFDSKNQFNFMKAVIYISGVIGEETNLTDVIRQFKSYDEPTEVEVVIDSIGGNVEEGESIYNYLKSLDVPVTTIAKKAYSISAQIFAAGETRIIEDIDDAFMIHFAWAKVEGKAEDLENMAEVLRDKEDEFASFYSELIDIDEDTVKDLLDNDTMLSGSEAVDMGFATELKSASLKAVAIYKRKEDSKTNKSKKMKNGKFKEFKKAMESAFNALFDGEVEKEKEVNALVLQDSDGTEIDFADLDSGDTPKVGDKGTIDGSPVSDGSYIIPSMDEATVVFVDGAISEVIPKEDEEEAKEEKKEETKEEVKAEKKEEINAEEVQQISVWTMEVINTSFAEGDVVKYMDWDDNEQTIGSGEFQLSDGRRVVTDATGVIVKIKEAEAEKEIEVDAETEAKLEKEEEKEAEVNAKLKDENKKLKIELKAKNKLIGSKEFKAEEQTPKTNLRKTVKGESNSLANIVRG